MPPGTRGELVLTHLSKELQPLVRYRTGDLTVLDATEPVHGRTVSLPHSVFGRTDTMVKAKGVKVYPSELRRLLDGVEAATGRYRLVVTRAPRGRDHLQFQVEYGAVDVPDASVIDAIGVRFKQQTLIAVDRIDFVAVIDGEPIVQDMRK